MNSSIWEEFNQRFSTESLEWTTCSVTHLYETEQEYSNLRKQNLISPKIESYITKMNFSPLSDMQDYQTLFVLAHEDPIREFLFQYRGKAYRVLVPPTYLFFEKTRDRIQKIFDEILQPYGYHARYFRTAVKNVAVHSGLAFYGRNNIGYFQKGHSGYRSLVFISDIPIKEDNWRELQFLPECIKCEACIRKCPTGALSANRIPVETTKCITLHNEEPSTVPFPTFISLPMHNCLVGCMECQKVCPKNKIMMQTRIFGGDFTERETTMLLNTSQQKDLPSSLLDKLNLLGLNDILDELPRNLQVLLMNT